MKTMLIKFIVMTAVISAMVLYPQTRTPSVKEPSARNYDAFTGIETPKPEAKEEAEEESDAAGSAAKRVIQYLRDKQKAELDVMNTVSRHLRWWIDPSISLPSEEKGVKRSITFYSPGIWVDVASRFSDDHPHGGFRCLLQIGEPPKDITGTWLVWQEKGVRVKGGQGNQPPEEIWVQDKLVWKR